MNKLKRFTAGVAEAPADIVHYRWMTYVSPEAKRPTTSS